MVGLSFERNVYDIGTGLGTYIGVHNLLNNSFGRWFNFYYCTVFLFSH